MTLLILLLALIPAILFFRNLRIFLPAPRVSGVPATFSVLIPARNEAPHIGDAVRTVLANDGEFEVLVLDDHSTDATAAIVRELAAGDPRVRLISGQPLPEGWCGKVHACHQLGQHARNELLVFLDADVRLAPDALRRFASFMETGGCDLASGVPRQITGTFAEKLLIPLIHFALLGFLPFHRMRRSRHPAYACAVGQLLVVRRAAYRWSGGHAAIWDKIHDGLGLARHFRRCELHTDVFDATDTATCRMYVRARDVWNGLAKNATEAMATPKLIVPCTALLFGGQVLPVLLLAARPSALSLLANLAWLTVRIASARRFRQSWLSVVLHPLGVTLLLVIQWQAFFSRVFGRGPRWKGRAHSFGRWES